MAVDKEELLRKRLAAREVDVEGVGRVKVRALTRAEVFEIRAHDGDLAEMDRRMLAAAMVEPALTIDEAAEWQRCATAGEIEPVTNEIARLSGLHQEAPKEAVRQFPG